MKKDFNVFDAFTVLAAYYFIEDKARFWVILLPWFTELIIYIIRVLITHYSATKRLEFSLWKFLLHRKIKSEVLKGFKAGKSDVLKEKF